MSTSPTQPRKTLHDISGDDGIFAIIAMDQRNTLRRMFTAVGLEGTDEQLLESKADVTRALTPSASGILLDPTYGVPAIQAADALDPGCGLLVASEPAKRESHNGEPRTQRDPALDARWVLDQGGDANKFFAQLRADRPKPAAGDLDVVAECVDAVEQVVRDCRELGIPSVIENLIYTIPGEDLTESRRADAIIEAARALNDTEPDLLKLEYPGSPEACRRLAAVVTRPWAVLSAGVPFDQFAEVMKIAFDEGGASGFIAGRSIWRESLALSGAERQTFLHEVARPRLETLRAVATASARPWTTVSTGS
jgi:tagatose 1,6-diphosphate aldolase/sulfofructosephosphate aldolase